MTRTYRDAVRFLMMLADTCKAIAADKNAADAMIRTAVPAYSTAIMVALPSDRREAGSHPAQPAGGTRLRSRLCGPKAIVHRTIR